MTTLEQNRRRLRLRFRASYLWIGLIGIAMACLLSGFALYGHFVQGGELRSLAFVLVMSSLWGLLGCYVIAARVWGYVEINNREVLQQGVSKSRRIPWRELKTVDWKSPGTTIVLRSASEKITVDPRGFERDSILPFIELLRDHTTHAEHIGWSEYVHQVALPLRKRRTATAENVDQETHIWSTRRRIDIFMGTISALFALVGVAMAIGLGQWRFLTVPFPMLLLWGMVRYSTPKTGEPQTRIRTQIRSKYVTWMFGWIIANVAGFGVAKVVGLADPIVAVWGVVAVVISIYLAFRVDRERLDQVRQEADGSLEEWDRESVMPK